MTLRQYKPELKQFELPPEGTTVGICIQVIDLGSVELEYEGHKKIHPQIWLTWELPDELMMDGRPFVIGRKYNLTFNKGQGQTSTLRSTLESWRGKEFGDEELKKGFNFATLLGRMCMITILRKKRDERVFANVDRVVAPLKGQKPVKPFNPLVIFDLSEFNQEVFNALPEFLQRRIQESFEYQNLNKVVDGEEFTGNEDEEYSKSVKEDDIPF